MKIFSYKEILAAGFGSAAILSGVVLYPSYQRASAPPELPASIAIAPTTPIETPLQEPERPKELPYLEVTQGCGPYYGGGCVNLRSGPTEDSPVVMKLRSGIVLQAFGSVENNGRNWYKVGFDEWVRYPDRMKGDLYVAAEFVRPFMHEAPSELATGAETSSNKRIIVDRSEQKLYAYEGDTLFMEESISTGLELTPTPRGSFKIFRKTPSRYMQGPIPEISDDEYDLPGVPWSLYFTKEGAAIHGTYWHDNFGQPWSHGCVNLPPEKARLIYEWAELGTTVIVRD